ncbi:TonB-dependent receptor [Brevundimonas sp. AJA228-03]|uniref:TonB-dependent receptor domain-containing protein n=1 Tax=Brevundimonas sp. AJA228-03 TaxID=2752515 RepID=UPI001ADFC4E3|nr:TonB-dependent receptor [Brevundimonas sp. AJA228-03]QTN20495.1 TonB-dependent receptor [Brevundimonas sp. AJA228-03]
MKTVTLTLSGVLLATSALIAPGLAYAQSTPTPVEAPGPTTQTPAEEAQDAEPEENQLDEIVVLGRYIPEPNRQSPEVAAFLTSEDLERTGDANAAEALTRVTGLSIVEGRFIYVRGLGERYSSALLNGSPLPSPEPLQRVVPLDLFPAEILEGVTVQKTYSVNFPGEFGGGVIDLNTVDTPNEPFFNMTASIGGNTETTGQDGLIYFGSRTDFLGFDDGTREVPGELALAFRSGKRIVSSNYTRAEIARIARSLENAPLRLLQEETTPINGSFRVTTGASTETGLGTLGALLVAGYDNSWRGREGVRQTGRIDNRRLVVGNDYDFRSNQNDIKLNALGAFSLTNEFNTLKWTNLYVRNVTKEARSTQGIQDSSGFLRTDNTEWFQRELFSSQLAGGHTLTDRIEFNWRAAYAKTTRDAPYETRFGYGRNAAGNLSHNVGTNPNISFSTLDDDVVSGGADLSYTLPLSDFREAKFSVGVSSSDNNRTSERRDLRFAPISTLSTDQLESRVDYLFSDFNIGQYITLSEDTVANGAYEGELQVNAAYAQVEAEVIPLVNITAGWRYEDAQQDVVLVDQFTGSRAIGSSLAKSYWLPAATVTWNFAEDLQLRVGASKTIGRPQFRELAPQAYTDTESDRTFIGNRYLRDTQLINVDARLEWYFARQQYLTGGLFYKDMSNPVETSAIQGGEGIQQTFLNAPGATIMGVEVEGKKYFEFPDNGMSFIANKRWLVQANYTFSDSEIQVGSGDRIRTEQNLGVGERATNLLTDGARLQGQSEHVANLQLGWEDDTDRSQATIIVNYVSERISARGIAGNPDLIQDPGVFLDFVYRKDFTAAGRELGFALELRNLLRTDYDEFQELGSSRISINKYELGRSASVSLTARF